MQDDIAIFDFIHQALNEDFFSAETVTAMDKVHFRSDVGQIKRFFNCGVAAADHRHFLVAVEETVAGCAGGNAAPFKSFFRWQPQIARGSAGRNDQRITSVLCAVTCQTERTILQIHFVDVIKNYLGFKFCRMFMHAFHQQRAGQIVWIAGPVFHFRRGSQLTAFFHTGNKYRL
ncbi:DNA segregation ATPase FtsK/SpoIIIE and related proteins [Salmonella enterica subsp. enterica serovar Bovismorbificans]|nr:DNA segregation ATPase FtsK/SpoIIIE and related proteins [Salmonella enterica subsp. enterica serovar Bovismorbificans]